ncbi:MAG: NAD(P)/FAD-dependent oxidoreductase [Negativicutes bacterium]|nr:NAD(P)/FAD-dependent oxidoreductase [Negativicutes bacterium]
MSNVIVVGGGAAGLLAGIAAAEQGAQVIILEKMFAPGRKILITGKGRCNITNDCEIPEIIKNLPGNGRFLNSALHRFSNNDIVNMLESHGLKTKVERGGRVFPVTDKAKDVVDTLLNIFRALGGEIRTDKLVSSVLIEDKQVKGVITVDGHKYLADAVILATGGASYPGTGSDGNGFRLAKACGHTIIALKPSLVPLESDSCYIKDLQGLSLRNVQVSICSASKVLGREFGEMIFTHFGFSGPIILSLSKVVSASFEEGEKDLDLIIDLKPALDEQKLDARIQRDFTAYARKQLVNGMKDLLPARLIPVVLDAAFLDPEKPINQISREERGRLVHSLKNLSFPITGTRPLAEAIITAGGVSTKEINPKTLESKIVKKLYFAGEIIDVDGYTGGYNLQAAFSTGYAAGIAAAQN